MNLTAAEYCRATRHPWSSVVFILPMLAVYEAGVLALGAGGAEMLRNGADSWLRWLFTKVGLGHPFWPGLFLALALAAWAWWARADRPRELTSLWMGMATESAAFALLLYGISLALAPALDAAGIALAASPAEPAMHDLVSFLGAGIYEEALFRLGLLSLLCWLFRLSDLPRTGGYLLAVLISALIFAAAHHVGPTGEDFRGYVFAFRTLAGIYFATLYQIRGFGIAVGAHAGYDILVGVLLSTGT